MAQRSRGRPPHPDVLTPAEWAVLHLWRHGLGRSQIAARRDTSAYAIRYHLRNIAGKLGIEHYRQLRHWPGVPTTSRLKQRSRPMDTTASQPLTDAASPATDNAETGGLSLGPLGQVSLHTRDAARAEAWYRDVLGLRHLFTFGDLVFFDCDGTRLYIRQLRAKEEMAKGSILYFVVPDIQTAYATLGQRGVHFQGAPHMIYRDDTTGDEEWMAFFDDPDGNTLAIMARVGG